jgi:hypothetical protein
LIKNHIKNNFIIYIIHKIRFKILNFFIKVYEDESLYIINILIKNIENQEKKENIDSLDILYFSYFLENFYPNQIKEFGKEYDIPNFSKILNNLRYFFIIYKIRGIIV